MLLVGVISLTAAASQPVWEQEPNESRTSATAITLLPGEAFTGTTSGSTTLPGNQNSIDFFLLSTPAPAGVTRYRLAMTTAGTVGHTVTIRGLNQSNGVIQGADIPVQISVANSTPARFVQWYAFGPGECRLYVSVTGTSQTVEPYLATLSAETVTPVTLAGGPLAPGSLRIITDVPGPDVNTDLWVYDGAGSAIPGFGNDDAGLAVYSELVREFPAGRYTLAISDSNIANNLPSPPDDGRRSGSVLDFPGVLACGSATARTIPIRFEKFGDVRSLSVPKPGPFDVAFVSFLVGASGCNPADIATEGSGDLSVGPDNFITGADFDAFIFAFFNDFRSPAGLLLADLSDGNGGGPDGFLTGADFDAFLAAFFTGC